MAVALSREDVIRAHARDELGIDVDNYTSPVQASAARVEGLGSVLMSRRLRILGVLRVDNLVLALQSQALKLHLSYFAKTARVLCLFIMKLFVLQRLHAQVQT